jgi:hypothetical protein
MFGQTSNPHLNRRIDRAASTYRSAASFPRMPGNPGPLRVRLAVKAA